MDYAPPVGVVQKNARATKQMSMWFPRQGEQSPLFLVSGCRFPNFCNPLSFPCIRMVADEYEKRPRNPNIEIVIERIVGTQLQPAKDVPRR